MKLLLSIVLTVAAGCMGADHRDPAAPSADYALALPPGRYSFRVEDGPGGTATLWIVIVAGVCPSVSEEDDPSEVESR
jgi:hypothetical protein